MAEHMSRAPSTFRRRDLTAALKAVIAAGCVVGRVEIRDGTIVIVTSVEEPVSGTTPEAQLLEAINARNKIALLHSKG